MKALFNFLLGALLAGCAGARPGVDISPDYAREQRLAQEFVPVIVVGSAVRIESASGHRFLGILTMASKPRGAVILAHGLGVHPDWGLIGELRTLLPERGYTTLSIQMPVLAADASPVDYPNIFREADARIAAAIADLRGRGERRIAIVSHSMGARMAEDYLRRNRDAPLAAWVPVSISSGRFEGVAGAPFPIFDIYAQDDLELVASGAQARAAVLRGIHGSKQAMVFGADHFYAKKERELADLIDQLLAPVMK